jgi:hypothetical protein
MSEFVIKKASKRQKKLRIAFQSASGAGKTMSALRTARGLAEDPRILVADTENGSSELYSDMFDFDIVDVVEPFSPEKYVGLIRLAESEGYDVIIFDTLTPLWTGKGGFMSIKEAFVKSGGYNDFTSWNPTNELYDAFIKEFIAAKVHIIATMRSKAEYSISKDNTGKMKIDKLGTTPQFRPGVDFEFTTVFALGKDNYCQVDKDRSRLFAGHPPFVADEETGRKLIQWLNEGGDPNDGIVQRTVEVETPVLTHHVAAKKAKPRRVIDEDVPVDVELF